MAMAAKAGIPRFCSLGNRGRIDSRTWSSDPANLQCNVPRQLFEFLFLNHSIRIPLPFL